jgi:hypothetical protein
VGDSFGAFTGYTDRIREAAGARGIFRTGAERLGVAASRLAQLPISAGHERASRHDRADVV